MPRFSKDRGASTPGSGYHIPEMIAKQQQSGSETHWMYDQQPKAAAASLAYSPAAKPPLLTQSASSGVADGAAGGSLGIAFVAGTAVALVGGLIWAAVVIETHYDIGFLAWLVGAATGATVFGIYGAPAPEIARVLAGVLAAAGILIGKYVIFVHELKTVLADLLKHPGIPVGYFDSRVMGLFIHHFSTVVRPIYALWFIIAFVAALVASSGGRRRRRQS